jgi:hypothetical protein
VVGKGTTGEAGRGKKREGKDGWEKYGTKFRGSETVVAVGVVVPNYSFVKKAANVDLKQQSPVKVEAEGRAKRGRAIRG